MSARAHAHAHDHDHGHAHGGAHAHGPGASAHDGHPERIAPGDAYWDRQYGEHAQRYAFAAARVPAGGRVLDAGCGVGYGTAILADAGASFVVGVDVAAGALEVARTRFARPNATWIEEDCVSLARAGEHGPFDAIVNFENLEHVSDAERFLDRVTALLAPDGVFVLSTPNRLAMNRMHGAPAGAPTANPFHSVEFSPLELHALLSRRFRQVTLSYQALEPAERFLYEPILDLLWSNPFARLGRALQRRLRGRRIADRVEDLLPPRTYQIVHSDPGTHLAITTIAECRGPLRVGA